MYPELSLEHNCQKNCSVLVPTQHGGFSKQTGNGFFSFQDYGAISTLGSLGKRLLLQLDLEVHSTY